MPVFKKYIQDFKLEPKERSKLVFSDATKIRMYDDRVRVGIRLKGTYNQFAKRMEFPLDTTLFCKLISWNPQAVKGWLSFEEISTKPTGTAIDWKLNDGTDDRYWNGSTWAIAAAGNWNAEADIADNISTFPFTSRTIRPIARLSTTDKTQTPILKEYKILIQAQFDWWMDFVDSVCTRIQADFGFITEHEADHIGGDSFNIEADRAFTPEQPYNITGIDAVYNHDDDSGHDTDLLSSFDSVTKKVTLTGTLPAGTSLWARYIISPEIVVNFTNSDYVEIGRTPAVVIDTIDVNGVNRTSLKRDLTHKNASTGYRLEDPLRCKEIKLGCALHTGLLADLFPLYTQAHAFEKLNGGTIPSKALDVEWSVMLGKPIKYNPSANFSDLKVGLFELVLRDVFLWVKDVKSMPIVTQLNITVNERKLVGPDEEFGAPITNRPAGEIVGIQPLVEIES